MMFKTQLRNLLQKIRIPLQGLGVAVICASPSFAQITGGQYAFEYLRMANAPHVSALGGISIANPDNDVAFALQNPALMREAMHNNLELSYNSFYSDIKALNLAYGYHVPGINTSFFMGVQYLNYGSITQTDPIGNTLGSFRAVDYALTLGVSHTYLEHWRYGADVKLASSDYTTVDASAALLDVGVNYYDTASLWDFGASARNMGVMIKRYTPNNTEPLPFDLQLGISKRFRHLPLRLIGTVHHLYQWDIRYSDPTIVATNALGANDSTKDNKSHFGDKLFRHFIFGADLTLAKRLTISASYNDLQRQELKLSSLPGLAGFAFGAGIELNKFQIHYARNYYHIAGAYNEFSITLALNRLIGLNKTGEHMHWNAVYDNPE